MKKKLKVRPATSPFLVHINSLVLSQNVQPAFQCLTLSRASVFNQSYLLQFKVVVFFLSKYVRHFKSRIRETLNLSKCVDRAIIYLPLAHLPWFECPGPPHPFGLFCQFRALFGNCEVFFCSLKHFLKIYFCLQGKCALFDRGKIATFLANVSKITGQMCHFQGKCALFVLS